MPGALAADIVAHELSHAYLMQGISCPSELAFNGYGNYDEGFGIALGALARGASAIDLEENIMSARLVQNKVLIPITVLPNLNFVRRFYFDIVLGGEVPFGNLLSRTSKTRGLVDLVISKSSDRGASFFTDSNLQSVYNNRWKCRYAQLDSYNWFINVVPLAKTNAC